MKEEEEEEEQYFFYDKKRMTNTINFSISETNDNISYTGVKSTNEETQSNVTNNDSESKQIKNNKNRSKKKASKKKKKKEIFPSILEENVPSCKNRMSFKDYLIYLKKDIREEDKNIKKYSEKNVKMEVETKYEWDEGGDLVYLTGSFCDWKDFYKMRKDDEGIFRTSLLLPVGFHQYKFKVDENWEYSKKQPKIIDNGNINNFIDTTNYKKENENKKEIKNKEIEVENIKIEKKSKSKSKSKSKKKSKNKEKPKKEKKKKRLSITHSINFLNSQNNYTSYYPLKSELNKKPLSLPGLYKTLFILNEDCTTKKERKYSHVSHNKSFKSIKTSSVSSRSSSNSSINEHSSEESSHSKLSVFGEIIPYVRFQNLYHIHSNHLHSKIIKYNNNTICSMTLRYRFKLSTFIYYKACKSKENKRRIRHSKTFKKKRIKIRKS